jgi:uncharacterized protein (DUF1501 family)
MKPLTRRTFLQLTGAAAVAASVPPALARLAASDRRILVVIHLQGGNDGFNTVVPIDSAGYRRARPTLALRTSDLLPFDENCGLHPACVGLHQLHAGGQLAIVRGVDASEPATTNHFAAEEFWETGGTGTGWLGDFIAAQSRLAPDPAGAVACFAGAAPPQAFGRVGNGVSESLAAAAHRAEIPSAPEARTLADDLQLVARLIAAGHPARVYWLRTGGFDTHFDQLRRHAAALSAWSDALAAFHRELASAGCARDVATLSFSEFSRSLAENATGGTDHGGAGPVFLTGSEIALRFRDAPSAIPIPQLYSTVLTDWLRHPCS